MKDLYSNELERLEVLRQELRQEIGLYDEVDEWDVMDRTLVDFLEVK